MLITNRLVIKIKYDSFIKINTFLKIKISHQLVSYNLYMKEFGSMTANHYDQWMECMCW